MKILARNNLRLIKSPYRFLETAIDFLNSVVTENSNYYFQNSPTTSGSFQKYVVAGVIHLHCNTHERIQNVRQLTF